MRLRVERHRARAALRGDVVDDVVFVGRRFVDDGQRRALAVRGEGELASRRRMRRRRCPCPSGRS